MAIFDSKWLKKGLFAVLFAPLAASAQMPTDAIQMQKGQVCAALMTGQDAWTEYWEGGLKRDNPNLGEFKSTMVIPMAAVGLTDKINVIAGLPFFKNEVSAGTLKAESGLQDLSLTVKATAFSKKIGPGQLDLLGAIGVSSPVRKYTADYLPLCVGLGAKTASARAIGRYRLGMGFFVEGQAGFMGRSNVEIDRNFYFVGEQPFYTNEVDMPDMNDWSASLGFLNRSLKVYLTYMAMNTHSTSDIRRNDMPFISNNMDATRAAFLIQYYLPGRLKGLSVMAMGGKTLTGRNVGQATSIGAGVAYQFRAFGKKAEATK